MSALDAQIAQSGRSPAPECSVWTLWTSRMLNLDALDVQIVQSGRSAALDCSVWTF